MIRKGKIYVIAYTIYLEKMEKLLKFLFIKTNNMHESLFIIYQFRTFDQKCILSFASNLL